MKEEDYVLEEGHSVLDEQDFMTNAKDYVAEAEDFFIHAEDNATQEGLTVCQDSKMEIAAGSAELLVGVPGFLLRRKGTGAFF